MSNINYDTWVKDGERYVKVADVKAICTQLKETATENEKELEDRALLWNKKYNEELEKNKAHIKAIAALKAQIKSVEKQWEESYEALKAKYDDPPTESESEEESEVEVTPLSKVD